jgi:uncharacterized protein
MRHTTDACVETYAGLYLDYLDPRPEQISLADIARGLAQTCRFAGQTTRYYSVAEHAVYVAENVMAAGWPDYALAALHHDSHEAYVGDWPSPLKAVFDSGLYRSITEDIDAAVATKFGFAPHRFKHHAIKAEDELMLRREAATLKYSHGIGKHWDYGRALEPLAGIGWAPNHAERRFLEMHRRLTT